MKELFTILITMHIAGGTVGLISGTIAASVAKGKKLHLVSGKIFFYSMLITAISALIISNLPEHHNVFLFAVGGFTLYLNCSGFRIVWLKRNVAKRAKLYSSIDYGIALFALIFGIFLITLSVYNWLNQNAFSIVPGVFGTICLWLSILDLKKMNSNLLISKYWISSHISKMMGTMIAAYTAFLVVNIHIKQNWILWLLPTVIGSGLISYFIRKYAPVKKLNLPVDRQERKPR